MAPLTLVKAAMFPDIPHLLQQLMLKNMANLEHLGVFIVGERCRRQTRLVCAFIPVED